MWLQLAVLLVSLALAPALAPRPPKPKAAALADFDFPQTKEGTPQVVVFGDCWIDGWTVLGIGNFRRKRIKSSGKK